MLFLAVGLFVLGIPLFVRYVLLKLLEYDFNMSVYNYKNNFLSSDIGIRSVRKVIPTNNKGEQELHYFVLFINLLRYHKKCQLKLSSTLCPC